MLWHCWLAVRKSIQPVKIEWWGVGLLVWLSLWSEMQIVCIWPVWCHCIQKNPSSFASFKSRLVLPLGGTGLPRFSWKKRPLNGYSSSSYTTLVSLYVASHRQCSTVFICWESHIRPLALFVVLLDVAVAMKWVQLIYAVCVWLYMLVNRYRLRLRKINCFRRSTIDFCSAFPNWQPMLSKTNGCGENGYYTKTVC